MFGNKDEKSAQEAAAKAEARLIALAPAGLAVEIMPVFGPDGASTKGGRRIGAVIVANWLMASYPRRGGYLKHLLTPVNEGLQALEHAGLVQRVPLGDGASHVIATRLGESALADGSVQQHLRPPAGS